jgi:hypothetical protein
MIARELSNITTLENFMKEKEISPQSYQDLATFKKLFGQNCIQKLSYKEDNRSWDKIKCELRKSEHLPVSQINHLSYLVHLDQEGLNKFYQIKELCLACNFKEIESYLPSISPQFFFQVFQQISDPIIQLSTLKWLNEKIEFQSYLEIIQKNLALMKSGILRVGMDQVKRISNQVMKELAVRDLYSTLNISSYLNGLLLDLRMNGVIADVTKMKEELAQIQGPSILKEYLIGRGVLDRNGVFQDAVSPVESRGTVVNSLKFLAFHLKIDEKEIEKMAGDVDTRIELEKLSDLSSENYNLIFWNEAIPKVLYARFLTLLDSAYESSQFQSWMKDLIEIRDSKRNSTEDKIRKSLSRLKSVKNQRCITQLKEALTITIKGKELEEFFKSGPLSSLDLGLNWDPALSFQEQLGAKEDLEFLYLKTLVFLAKEKGLTFSEFELYQSYDRGETFLLEELSQRLPQDQIKTLLINQVSSFYNENLGVPPCNLSPYDLFLAFKKHFTHLYKAVQNSLSNPLNKVLAEEAYINHDVNTLLEIEPLERPVEEAYEVPLATDTFQLEFPDGLSSLFEEIEVEDLTPYQFKKLDSFYQWIGEVRPDSILKAYMLENGVERIGFLEGSDKEILKHIQSSQELFISLLKKEAQVLRRPFPEKINSLEHLEDVAQELSYAKFLKGVQFLENTYKSNERAFTFLNSLKMIDQGDLIPLSEKRVFSLKFLRKLNCPLEIAHQNKLLNMLENPLKKPVNIKVSKVRIDGFKGENKDQALHWLFKSSFAKSLEIVTAEQKGDAVFQIALQSFKDKIESEMTRLNIPGIYLALLEDAIEKGDLLTLDTIWHEVAYLRYFTLIDSLISPSNDSILVELRKMHASLEGVSIFEKVSETKSFLRNLKDPKLTNRLLFELENLSYGRAEIPLLDLNQLADKILNYLEQKDRGPFARFLEKNKFSPLFLNMETLKWALSLYKSFIQKNIKKALSTNYTGEGGVLLVEELKNLKPFEFDKLDKIADLIESQSDMDLPRCAKFGFNYGIAKRLSDVLVTNPIHEVYAVFCATFELIPDSSIRKNLLKHLMENGFQNFVQFMLTIGRQKVNNAAFECLKEKLLEPGMTEERLAPFVMQNFLNYDSERVENSLRTREKSKEFLEKLEDWLSAEGSASAIKHILEREGVIDSDGKIIPLFSYQSMANRVRNTLYMISDVFDRNLERQGLSTAKSASEMDVENFNSFDARFILQAYTSFLAKLPDGTEVKRRCQETFDNNNCSWLETVCITDNLLFECKEPGIPLSLLKDTIDEVTSCTLSDLKSLIYDPIEQDPLTGFSWYLNKIGIKPIEGLSLVRNYEYYLSWKDEVIQYIYDKVQKLKEKNHRGPIAFHDFANDLNFYRQDMKFSELDPLVDKIVYTEYQMALNDMPLLPSSKSATKKIINAQMTIRNKTPHQMIEEVKATIPKLGISEENKEVLKGILEKKDFLLHNTKAIGRDWDRLKESPFNVLPCFQSSASSLSIYSAHATLAQFYTTLGDSLKENVIKLNMNPLYVTLIEKAHYGQSLPFWFWLCNEVSYEKYIQTLNEKQATGVDVSSLLDLDRELGAVEVAEKIKKTIAVLKQNLGENIDLISILNWKTINDLIHVF